MIIIHHFTFKQNVFFEHSYTYSCNIQARITISHIQAFKDWLSYEKTKTTILCVLIVQIIYKIMGCYKITTILGPNLLCKKDIMLIKIKYLVPNNSLYCVMLCAISRGHITTHFTIKIISHTFCAPGIERIIKQESI